MLLLACYKLHLGAKINIDYHALAPELIIIFTIVGALSLDLIFRRKNKYLIAIFSVVGTVASLIPIITLWFSKETNRYLFEGSYVIDRFSLILKGIFILATYLTLVLSVKYIESEEYYQGEYYFLLLCSLLGAVVIASSRDLLILFIGIELASGPMFLLSGWKKGSPESNEGAIKFFLLGVLSAALILYGFSLLYGLTGQILFDNIATSMASSNSNATVLAIILVIAGIGFKISAVPFHSWAPDTYQGAPIPVTAYLSVSSKAAGFVALLLFTTKVVPSFGGVWGPILLIMSGATMTVGNLIALQQDNAIRLLAYSSIAQAGFIIAPIAASGFNSNYQDSIFSSVTYIAIYTFMNLGAFAVVLISEKITETLDIYRWGNMAKASPLVGLFSAMFFFSLAGIPPLGGWFAKFVVFRSLLGVDSSVVLLLAAIGAINAVVALVYYARVVKIMWMDESTLPSTSGATLEIDKSLSFVGLFTLFITIIVGFFPNIFGILGQAATQLLLP